jgi:hypothetical protein
MSKTREIERCVDELRNAALSLTAVADHLTTLFDGTTDKVAESLSDPKTEPSKTKEIKLEQVRAVLAEKSRDGHTSNVRALLEKHGAVKLSEIDPLKYPDLLREAEALGNA